MTKHSANVIDVLDRIIERRRGCPVTGPDPAARSGAGDGLVPEELRVERRRAMSELISDPTPDADGPLGTAPDPAARSDAGVSGVGPLRYGQAVFNDLHRVAPDLADTIRATDADPFHVDERVPDFLRAVLDRARADGAAEERERIAAAIEAEADGTFNELRARHFRTAVRIARGGS